MSFRRLVLVNLAVIGLVGCATTEQTSSGIPRIPASPAAVADRTTLDESALRRVELGYRFARTAAELAVDAGVLRGAAATKVAELDNQAFAALGRARQAYRIVNADSYLAALREADLKLADISRLIPGAKR